MELHSYAKRRATKKWSTEQKQKLVDARIKYDTVFSNMPTNSVVPWKKILNLAKLDDYNVFFVRTQWAKMVAKYKQYKHSRLGHIPTKAIDDEMIRKITNEWEFFQQIHHFMTRRTTNLHSYALTADHEPSSRTSPPLPPTDNATENTPPNHQQQQQSAMAEASQRAAESASSNERINAFSSDTNEDFAGGGRESEQQFMNTDHDMYAKSPGGGQQSNYFADASEDTQESTKFSIALGHPLKEELPMEHDLAEEQVRTSKPRPATKDAAVNGADRAASGAPPRPWTEREKYYQHKRRFNRRLERRFDALLNVFGQIVKAEYPSIDVSPLGASAAVGCDLVNKFLSTDDGATTTTDDDDEDATASEGGRGEEDAKSGQI